MSTKVIDAGYHRYSMPRRGVNLYSSPITLHPEEAMQTKNCYFKNGLIKREGMSVFETDEVVANKAITGLHRFYYGASKQLLVASDTVVKYHDGATWQNVSTGLTAGQTVQMVDWGDIGKCFIANGSDVGQIWDGTTKTTLTAVNAPTAPTQFLPYQDRLLAIEGGAMNWSDSFTETTDWVTVASANVRPDTKLYGMAYHSLTNSDAGLESTVLLAGATGMYLFKGTNLAPSGGDYTIHTLAVPFGCNAPRTMQWTPKGTIWLGTDRQVYLLPFNSSTPIPIGHKIQSFTYLAGIEGIEDASVSNLSKACAAYHKGFYILSIPGSSSFNADTQWWLDVEKLYKDENNLYGPWFGPMTGQDISVFIVQNGAGDRGELMGGDGSGTTGKSLVYEVRKPFIWGDNGVAIPLLYQSFLNPLGIDVFNYKIDRIEFTLIAEADSINLDLFDITGSIKTSILLPISDAATYWDDVYWGEEFYFDFAPVRIKVDIIPAVLTRRLSILLKHETADTDLQLIDIIVEAVEERVPFL